MLPALIINQKSEAKKLTNRNHQFLTGPKAVFARLSQKML